MEWLSGVDSYVQFVVCLKTRWSTHFPIMVTIEVVCNVVFPPSTEQDASNRLSTNNSAYSQIVAFVPVLNV